MATINTNNANAKLAGTVICPSIAVANALNWSTSGSQSVHVTRTGRFIYGNRAVSQKNEQFFVKARGGEKIEVRRIGENKYEVIV